MMRVFRVSVITILILSLSSIPATARGIGQNEGAPSVPVVSKPDEAAAPYTTVRVHDAGNLELSVTNWGAFGNPYSSLTDPVTGLRAPGAVFPAGFNFEHLNYGALWVGALVETALGYDTLVSTAYDLTELYPESYARGGAILQRTNDNNSPYYHPHAVSGQDFICSYTDTLTSQAYVPPDPATFRRHRPIPIKVRQGSYVWPYEYAEDFVIIQYWIINMRDQPLHEVRVGILASPRVYHLYNNMGGGGDDMVGFLETAPSITGHSFDDTVMAAWLADNDGDPYHNRSWNDQSVRSALGIRFLSTRGAPCPWQESPPLEHSFNWWVGHSNPRYDWGPQLRPGDESITGSHGTPLGDAQKYRYMANREIDYDQHLANDPEMTGEGWMSSPGIKSFGEGQPYNIANGHSVNMLLSVGPYEIEARDSIPVAIGVFAGDYLHRDPTNGRQYLDKYPRTWFGNLDFGDLGRNAQWASWIYDNPGVDTDNDGCFGLYRVSNCRDTMVYYDSVCYERHGERHCWYDFWWEEEVCDSVYTVGDGVPDMKGPPPPPSPKITINTEPGKIKIQWDGRESELYFDPFAQREDFEGYNVYAGLGHNPNTLNLMASWDRIDYDRYRYVPELRPVPWVMREPPFTHKQLCELYGADFDPARYPDNLHYFEDELGRRFFFKPNGGNRGSEYLEHGTIVRNPIQFVRTDSLWNEARQVWQHFGHYECTLEDLLPSQPYYFAVTAFDFGLAGGNLGPLESAPQANMQLAYATDSPEYVAANRLKVSVYPNPYKIDAEYRKKKYEDPNREGFLERTRRIHFVNLPPQATIKIFSLDGDLIRELHHPESRFSDTPSHTAWDLITRNTQAVTSGIYLYSVESEWGTQVGKIVIIK